MSLQKQSVDISFGKGLDSKTDPFRVPLGNFLRLENSVFTVGERMTKRNGYGQLTALPEDASFLTTFNGNLTALSDSIQAFIDGSNKWVNKGTFYPISLVTLPLIRSSTNQPQSDTAIADNGLVCTVFTDTGSGSTTYKYAVSDSITGQNVLSPAIIPTAGTGLYSPRVFLLRNYFIIVFGSVISATNHLQYVVINTTNPSAPTSATDISTVYSPESTINFDAVVANNMMYIGWNGSDVGGAIRLCRLDVTLTLSAPVVYSGYSATLLTMTADTTGNSPIIWTAFYDDNTAVTTVLAVDFILNPVLAPTDILTGTTLSNITGVAQNAELEVLYELPTVYAYDSAIPTHSIRKQIVSQAGSFSAPVVVVRSLGLASKAFIHDGGVYVLGIYFSAYQPSYFLINDTGQVVSKLAYSNAGEYYITGLPNSILVNDDVYIPYLFKDLVESVNKTQGVTNTAGVYSQTGVNMSKFTFGTESHVSEIANNLNLTGGFLWGYDGYSIVENNFFVWPDNVEVTTAATGGFLEDQEYFYQAIYEWADNQGNLQRSAPSVPVSITTAGGDTSANTVYVPTLRLTYKIANPVKIIIYRWSTNQQNYYQITSVTVPTLNTLSADFITFVDTQVDADILGNSLIYTTGGVIENISPPSFSTITLFDSRLWGIDSEDNNLLWYSKQVIEAVPVEMSDLFTVYVAPSISAQGSTGPNKCLAPMDDKLIIFKPNAMYYINGIGPDNLGTNSQYSQPTFITSTVGCSNQKSIVFMQDGLMFQSDKGIWLLNRSLGTQYIGAAVEGYTQNALVQSAVNIPGTTQVRFTMDTGITLMYDYFYQQWGTFTNVPAVSSTLYLNQHTYLDRFNRVYQETPGKYLDGAKPVLQAFTTSWISAAGFQGFQRAYWLYLAGTYKSPHMLNVTLAYDFNNFIKDQVTIAPDNFNPTWGSLALWGSGDVWGGSTNIEQQRVFFKNQKCESFQVSVDEIYDNQYGSLAGEGLSLSGLMLTIGTKKSYKPLTARQSSG